MCTYITNNFAKFKVIDTNINEFLPITKNVHIILNLAVTQNLGPTYSLLFLYL